MTSARISRSRPTRMTGTIHKGLSLFFPCRSRTPTRVRLFCLGIGTCMAGIVQAHAAAPRPATAEALAHELDQRASATATLQQHCPRPITAHLLDRAAPPALQRDARQALQASPTTRLVVRHVQLLCGRAVWSEAWNLYLPDRLTPDARRKLAGSHVPFGKAVGETTFSRQRLGSRFTGLPAGVVLENRAILHRRVDQRGFSYLVERYKKAALEIRTPQATSSDVARHQVPASVP